MKMIELDLTGCKNWRDLHERIRIAFDFEEWYGKNWSAFWDLLSTDIDIDRVIVKGEQSMPKAFGEELAIMHEVLEDNVKFRKKYNFNPFSYEIIS